MGPLSYHNNQTKRQMTIILSVFKSPTQATFLPNWGQIASAVILKF